DDGTDGGAGGDESKEPLPLFAREQIDHRRPEDGDDEHVEDRDPDEEDPADPDLHLRLRRPHQDEEDGQIEHEETVGPGDEAAPWQPRDERPEQRVAQYHARERAEEQPRQVRHAARNPQFVADRTDDVVRRQDAEEVQPRPGDGCQLRRPDIDQPPQHAIDAPRMFHAGDSLPQTGAGSSRPPAYARPARCRSRELTGPCRDDDHELSTTPMTQHRYRRFFLFFLVVAVSIAFVLLLRSFLVTILLAAVFSGLVYPLYARIALALN